MSLRRGLYRIGFRPRQGSIWYSPSLAMMYSFNNFGRDLQAAIDKTEKEIRASIEKARKEMDDGNSTEDGVLPS